MNRPKILMFTALCLFTSMIICYASGKETSNSVEPTIPAEGYNKSGLLFPDAMKFSLGNCVYDIPFHGQATRVCDSKSETKFEVPVQAGANVWVRLEYLPYNDDLILIYDTQNDREDWGAGMATRLNGKSLLPKWSVEIHGFNTCPCLREGSFLYVTGSGFLGKIDLEKGKYIWSIRLEDFIDAFELPRLINKKIIFTEGIEGTIKGKARVIEVDKETGKILKK